MYRLLGLIFLLAGLFFYLMAVLGKLFNINIFGTALPTQIEFATLNSVIGAVFILIAIECNTKK
ncbi:MAG: hypothetical protein AB1546_11760 [bacterium]